MRYTSYLLSAGLMLAALNSQAAPYLLLETGQVRSNSLDTHQLKIWNQSRVDAGDTTVKLSENTKNTPLLLGLGYQYTSNFALEVSYLDLGKTSATSYTSDVTSDEVTRTRIVQDTAEQRGLLFSAVGTYPVNQLWQLKGYLGLAWLDQKASRTFDGQSINATGNIIATADDDSLPSFHRSHRELAPVIGLGTGYQLNPDWQLQLNWRRIIGTEPGVLGEQDLNLLTAGLSVSF